jgi:DNA polymerase-3 subunit delta'
MAFANIVGHERQKKQLRQAWSSHRLAHAYLFTGTEGIGKRLMAMALIRLIFCDNQTGCGNCPACHRLDHNNHPDLHLVEPEGNQIKIEQVRQLRQDLAHPPTQAPRRACIIDNAERLNAAASNALLKTLEEPRQDTIIILITSSPEQLISTIKSRCQLLPFQRLEQKMIAAILAEHNSDDSNSTIIAALSAGSLKQALGNDSEYYSEQRQSILKEIYALNPNSVVPRLDLAERLANDKEQIDNLLLILLSYYRDIFLLKNQASPALIINVDMTKQLERQIQRETLLSAQNKLQAILDCHQQIARNVNKQLALDVLLIRLTAYTSKDNYPH